MLPIFVITFKQSHLYFIQTCKTRRSIGVGSHPVELAAKWNGQHATCALFMAKHQQVLPVPQDGTRTAMRLIDTACTYLGANTSRIGYKCLILDNIAPTPPDDVTGLNEQLMVQLGRQIVSSSKLTSYSLETRTTISPVRVNEIQLWVNLQTRNFLNGLVLGGGHLVLKRPISIISSWKEFEELFMSLFS